MRFGKCIICTSSFKVTDVASLPCGHTVLCWPPPLLSPFACRLLKILATVSPVYNAMPYGQIVYKHSKLSRKHGEKRKRNPTMAEKIVFPEAINELIHKRDELRRQVMARRIATEAWDKNLDVADKELAEAKEKSATLNELSEYLLKLLDKLNSKTSKMTQTNAEKDAVVARLRSLNKLQSELLSESRGTNVRLHQTHDKFISQVSRAPWLPEKNQLLTLKDTENGKHEQVLHQIRLIETKIEDLRETLDDHKKLPFRQFCVQSLAFYCTNRAKLMQLKQIEGEKNKNLKRKLENLGPSQADISMILSNDEQENENNLPVAIEQPQLKRKLETLGPGQDDIAMSLSNDEQENENNLSVAIEQPQLKRKLEKPGPSQGDISMSLSNDVQENENNLSVAIEQPQLKRKLEKLGPSQDDIAMSLSNDEQENENNLSIVMEEPQEDDLISNTQTKDVFTSQTEFVFSGTGDDLISREPVDENFLDIMRSSFAAENNDDGGHNFMDFFGASNDKTDNDQGFEFNFGDFGGGNSTANESVHKGSLF
ncbi:hypothetical protein Ddc_02386 [Ditylenchus destructor]|nr:hypothetical protein Ddc_02386 [Ditylenchus destructor]